MKHTQVETKILRINLNNNTFRSEIIDVKTIKKYLGGKALGIYLANRDRISIYEPFSEKNKVYLLGGLISGYIGGAGATSLITKSPLTDTISDSTAQSQLSYSLRSAGYIGFIIEGKAGKPVCIHITDSCNKILPAKNLWGKSTLETTRILKEQNNGINNLSVMSIGQAGENLIRYSATLVDSRAFGRGGSGAILGDKKVKAIIVGGSGKLPQPCNKKKLNDQIKQVCKIANTEKHQYVKYQKYGTVSIFNEHLKSGVMTGKNFREVDRKDKKFKYFIKKIIQKIWNDKNICFKCPIKCNRVGLVKNNKDTDIKVRAPEFESVWALGPQCGNVDSQLIMNANNLCDQFGLDTISTGNVIAFYQECIEKNILKASNENILEIIKKIVYRKGIGDILAEGVKKASKYIGKNSVDFANHVKGLEPPAYDPRGYYGIALAYAVSTRGACHRKSFCSQEAKGSIYGGTIDGKADIVIRTEHESAIRDSLVICKWASAGLNSSFYSKLVESITGLEINTNELNRVGERAINLARLFNMQQGYTREDDTLPKRFLNESKIEGPLKGAKISVKKLEKLKDEYYLKRGWSKKGVPTIKKWNELNLPFDFELKKYFKNINFPDLNNY